jgi:hypothetical protein
MSVLILRSCLSVYVKAVRLDGTTPSEFSPGPFIAASIIPRCFDESRHVQGAAFAGLQALIQIILK